MNKNISVIGLGYVGLCTAVCFAARGYKVRSFDNDASAHSTSNTCMEEFYNVCEKMLTLRFRR